MSFRFKPSRQIRLLLPSVEAASWRQGGSWVPSPLLGVGFPTFATSRAGRELLSVCTPEAHSLNLPFTCVLSYPCAHVQEGCCSPFQPPLSLFFSHQPGISTTSWKKIARVYVKCHPTSQLSQLVPLNASGMKTASIDSTMKASLSCVFLVLSGFGFVSLSSDSWRWQHHSAHDSMGWRKGN